MTDTGGGERVKFRTAASGFPPFSEFLFRISPYVALRRAISTDRRNTLSFYKKMECEQWFIEHVSDTQRHRRRTSGIVDTVIMRMVRTWVLIGVEYDTAR